MVAPGMAIREDSVADADVLLEAPDWAPSKLHRELFDSDRLGGALLRAVRDIATGHDPASFRERLTELGVTALGGLYADLCVAVARGNKNAAFDLQRATRQLGGGQTSFDLRSPREDIRHGALPILRAAEVTSTPTVGVVVGQAFRDPDVTRSDHRRDSLALLRELADGCRVILVAGPIAQSFLWHNHRNELPPSVESACNPHPAAHASAPDIEAQVADAREALTNSPKPTRILELIGEEPADVLTYSRIEDELSLTRGTVRSHAKRLRDLDLVSSLTWHGSAALSLTPTGIAFLDRRNEEIGRQKRLGDCVEQSEKACKYSRVNQTWEGGGGPAHTDRRQHGQVVDVDYMPLWRHSAVVGSATKGGVTLVDHPQQPSDELRQPYLSHTDDTLVVGAEYTNPLQYWVCIARALTDPRVWQNVLTPSRLDGKSGNLGGLLTDDLRILRDARCLGYLKDADANGADYAAALMNATDALLDLLRRWHNDDYEDATEFRRLITKEALGIAGTVAHLCDLADITLVRELRLPEFTRRFDAERCDDLLKTVARGISIQSRHGHFSAYRQLFETREDKRAAAMEPSVPADDPLGEFIGSLVIVGEAAPRIEDRLRKQLRDSDVHEDAPEFEVAVPIRTSATRSAYATTMHHVLGEKSITPTREAVSLSHALVGSVYDVAYAFGRGLSGEDRPRELRLDEVRRALATLDADRLVPEMPPTLGKLVKTLLTTAAPLSKSELADRAGVSAPSVRTHLPKLEALGLVQRVGSGYRFALPFETDEERGQSIAPLAVTDKMTYPSDVLYDLGTVLVGDSIHDPDHPMGAPFFSSDVDQRIQQLCEVFGEWGLLVCRLVAMEPAPSDTVATFGPTPEQAPLPTEVIA